MKHTVYVFFEGDGRLVPGFNDFFRSVRSEAQARGVNVRPVAGAGRAVRDFNNARRDFTDATVLLLMDSEGPVSGDVRDAPSLQPHLQHLAGVDAGQLHLMVQLMEAWFLADRDALRVYYGGDFAESCLPGDPGNVEAIPKNDVTKGLNAATAKTSKGRYDKHKVSHGRDLLKKVDPDRVRAAAPHCERLFRELEAAINLQDESSN